MRGSFKVCTDYDLPYEHLSAGELSGKFPGSELPQEFEAVYQPDGGFINPARCVQAHVEPVQEHGVTTRAHETVVNWESTANGVTAEADWTTYRTNHAVVTVGAWTQLLAGELEGTLMPWRIIVDSFQPENRSRSTVDSFPVFSTEDEQQSYYGGPAAGTSGFRFGLVDSPEDVVDPNNFDLRSAKKERERLRIILHEDAQRYFPEGTENIKRLKAYMVTHTPNQDFIADYLPSDPNVVAGVGFSGKDFKFSCLMDEPLADLVTESDSAVNISLFGVDRFQTMPW